MATKLKVVEDVADIVPAPVLPKFETAPTRNRHAGWTAERQRRFIERLALTGHVGDACAMVGLASSSAYRLKNKAGAEAFSRAWDAALRLCATRLASIAFDRAINGRVERHYKNDELVMERRIPSDHLLTWLLARLDPLQFGSPTARALAIATGDPRDGARNGLPDLIAGFEDIPLEECAVESIDFSTSGSVRPAADSPSTTGNAADPRAHVWACCICCVWRTVSNPTFGLLRLFPAHGPGPPCRIMGGSNHVRQQQAFVRRFGRVRGGVLPDLSAGDVLAVGLGVA
jgi:hypothetical protein